MIFSEKYSIIRVLESTESANYYIVKQRIQPEKLLIVNEFFDKEKIKEVISDFMILKQENRLCEFVEYFSEDSKFYVVFEYLQGSSFKEYIGRKEILLEHKTQFLKSILLQFMNYVELPPFIRYSMLCPENIFLYQREVKFHYKLNLSMVGKAETDIYSVLTILLKALYTEAELRKNTKLLIIYEKAEKGLYHSVGDILKDIEDVLEENQKKIIGKELFLEKKQKVTRIIARVFAIFVAILAVYTICERLSKQSEDNEIIYLNVDKIGTVFVNPEMQEEETMSSGVISIDNAQ